MSFLEYLEKECPGDDAHDGIGHVGKRPLLQRCGKCREIYEEHQKELASERARILEVVTEEAGNYSYKEEMVRPSIVAAIFVNSVMAKLAPKKQEVYVSSDKPVPAPAPSPKMPEPEGELADVPPGWSPQLWGYHLASIAWMKAMDQHYSFTDPKRHVRMLRGRVLERAATFFLDNASGSWRPSDIARKLREMADHERGPLVETGGGA